MARRARSIGLLALFTTAAGCAAAPESGEAPDAVEVAAGAATAWPGGHELHEKWFVELEEEPLARGGDPVRLADEKARFRARVAASRIPVVERYTFDRLWNGISLHVEHRSAAVIAALPGVRAIYPVVPIVLDKLPPSQISPDAPLSSTAPSVMELSTALAMTGADVAQSALGLTGEKVRVAVIDSGIDIHHPDLGGNPAGCFGPGCRVAYGYDFVGDAYDASTSGTVAVPDPIPDDCAGHGTHVAGIVGAHGVVNGVAPGVIFGAYRVFGCSGTTEPDVMIKAMEMAQADGMRVVNMSIGSAFQWPDYPTSKAAEQLVKDGIVVVCSIGNNGTSGIWAAGAPGVGRSVIGVASYDNTATKQPAITISPDAARIGFTAAAGAPPPPLSGTVPIARTGTPTTDGDACVNPPAPGSLTGKIALIRRGSPAATPGSCPFYLKAKAAMDAGAVGVVFYNNVPGPFSPSVNGSPPITIPAVMITAADGATINARLDAGPVTMDWTTLTVATPSPTAGRISSFSSYGPAPDLSFKPDLGAPGGNIYSTYPLELGGYDAISGTSMASPHVAGAAALLLEARPDVPAARVRDLLQNTAVPAAWPGNTAHAEVVHRQGAGMMHIDLAVQSRVTVTPARIALGEGQGGGATLTLVNDGAAAVTYDLSDLPAASTYGSFWTPSTTAGFPSTVVFGAPSVTVPAGGQATVDVTITSAAVLPDKAIYGGYLVLTPQAEGTTLRVPYMGYRGDYQALTVLTPTPSGYPWLAKKTAGPLVNQPNGATFTLQSGDVPYVVLHLERPARRLEIDVFDAVKGKPYGNAADVELMGQALTPNDVTSFAWPGTTIFNKQRYRVPNGKYVLKLSVLKALGNPDNAADWETWTSPVVTLNHP